MSYAEGTTVSAEKSRAEIETMVTKYAGRDAEFGLMRADGQAVILFAAHGRRLKFIVPLPSMDEAKRDAGDGRSPNSKPSPGRCEEWIEQETRRRWRCMCLAIKAKFVAVESGSFTFEEEFLSHLVRPDGRTIYESIQAAVADGSRLLPAVEDGKVVSITGKALRP